jgi:hypothetical protein
MVNIYYLRWLARLSRDVKDVKDVKLGYQFTDVRYSDHLRESQPHKMYSVIRNLQICPLPTFL